MTNDTRNTPHETSTDSGVEPASQLRVERIYEIEPQKTSRIGPFVAGFLTATIAALAAALVFLAVSDADDDGSVEIQVPAVDIDG